MRKTYVIRLFVVAVVFGVTAYFQVGNIIAALIGVMSLKISRISSRGRTEYL